MSDDCSGDHPARLYDHLTDRALTDDECFLCGLSLGETNRTDEHVIPRWVQAEFQLWDQRLTLLNGTTIPYRQLVIPCCSTCNTKHLSGLEQQVRDAWYAGFATFSALDRDVLFLWLAKIVYGLLVRSLFLPVDRSKPDDGPIVEPELVQEFRLHRLLLQAARGVVSWSDSPASIVLVQTKTTDDPRRNFDMADSPVGPVLTMRLGHVGILSILQDWGTFERSRFMAVERVRDHLLAPIQFRELMAFTRYMAQKNRLNPALLLSGHEGGSQRISVVGSLAGRAYEDFVVEEYARLLAFVLDIALEKVLVGDRFTSWLTTPDGNPLDVPFEAEAGPPPHDLPGTISY